MNNQRAGARVDPRAAIAVTPGEPAGIGPDLLIRIVQEQQRVPMVAIADEQLLLERARILNLPLEIHRMDNPRVNTPAPAGSLYLQPLPLVCQTPPGQPDAANAESLLEALRQATEGCLAGHFRAMVTGPINKAMINKAGIPFTGHTEFIADLCRAEQPVMLLTGGILRVALATTHMPLSEVSQAITQDRIEGILTILIEDLKRLFNIHQPRILVLGLNPHAGESGHLGAEEINSIQPAITRLNKQGFHVEGPAPADTAFLPARLRDIDAVLAMYHDQGLPVLKRVGFGQAVNITLGLPIIRTSVDHGTALELAGTDCADIGSFKTALDTAVLLAENRAGTIPCPGK